MEDEKCAGFVLCVVMNGYVTGWFGYMLISEYFRTMADFISLTIHVFDKRLGRNLFCIFYGR